MGHQNLPDPSAPSSVNQPIPTVACQASRIHFIRRPVRVDSGVSSALNGFHIFVRKPEMMSDFMDNDVANQVAEIFLGLTPVIE